MLFYLQWRPLDLWVRQWGFFEYLSKSYGYTHYSSYYSSWRCLDMRYVG